VSSDDRHLTAAPAGAELRAHRTLDIEESHFRLLVESVKDYAIFILDPRGYVRTWNPGAERIKGYLAGEIIGKHFSIFYPPEEVAAGKCDSELETATREGRFEEEGWRVRKDGSPMWANVTITALHDPQGKLVGFAKVTRDLTEQRAAEERLRVVTAEKAVLAEKARIQEFQERFIAVLGHDLRNPLASIDMGAGILAQKMKDPALTEVVGRLRASSQRMSRMIEQILDLARSRLTGGFELVSRPLDLCELLQRITDEIRTARPHGLIELHCRTLTGSWDQDRIEQVFSNLIGNAVRYGEPAMPITVSADGDDRTVWVEVHNQGTPIPPELQRVLFDPFRRGQRDSRTPETEGLGLGLYISKEIARAHGGTIEVRSSRAEGTTFRVTLPRTGHWG
jgi:PAS domain S-box-containing protein